MKAVVDELLKTGQSFWYDNIQRRILKNGELAGMIERGEIRGVTSNPTIFNNAIGKSSDYDQALTPMAWAGWSAEKVFYQLAVEDIRKAADLFMPLYEYTHRADGYVSLEVNPFLAHDTHGTVSEAKRLWDWVNRPNLMIKIPATVEGIPAITQAIAAGINVNVTLIFSLERYAAVIEAYLKGLEIRISQGNPIDRIASVASFFVSRVDTKIDNLLSQMAKSGKIPSVVEKELQGKAAIANARLAYDLFLRHFQSERFSLLKAKGARVQRPLWASTSTKNPAYRDVMYVEELIGADTVNTLPPQTLTAFLDHGVVRKDSILEKIDVSQNILQQLEDIGISMKEVTDQLEVEGVKSFSDSFSELISTINNRISQAQKDIGVLAKPVAQRISQLSDNHASQRIFAHDSTFWTEDEIGKKEVEKRLGWLTAPQRAKQQIPDLIQFARQVSQEGYTRALLLGMGGSSLAPEVIREIVGVGSINGKAGLDLKILDSTHPDQVKAAARWAKLGDTLFIVSSKSGTTGEINAYFHYFWAKVFKRFRQEAGKHFIAITDHGTVLEKIAIERGFRKVFQADEQVGGRYSALIEFGLIPAALMGLNLYQWIERALEMADECGVDVPEARNPGISLGALIGQAALDGRDKLTLITDPEVSSFGAWLEQLVAESSGKSGKGIVPIDGEALLPAPKYSSDRLFVYLKKGAIYQDKVRQLQKAGHPVITFSLDDSYDLSKEFYRWEMAIAVACAVIGVNAFDQPDVQDAKDRTNRKITEYRQYKKLNEGVAIWESVEGKIYGQKLMGFDQANSLQEIVRLFLNQLKDGDYLAINAYLPRNRTMITRLNKLRRAIQLKTGKATTLGFGPRFLHSTGQLHKGGADNGVFLQITNEPKEDIAIPGQDLSFGTLVKAQALGDFEALAGRNRRLLRIHLMNADVMDLIPRS